MFIIEYDSQLIIYVIRDKISIPKDILNLAEDIKRLA